MTDPILTAARELANDFEHIHRFGSFENAVRALHAFALRQRAEGAKAAALYGEDAARALAARLEAQAKDING